MPLDFSVSNPNGESGNININDLTQHLRQAGENVVGVSADGMSIKISDGQGEFDVDPKDILKQHGWELNQIKPQTPDYGNVNTS